MKGTASKSASGASMSKYDVEVEARLRKLESQAHAKGSSSGGSSSDRIDALEAKIDDLILKLSKKMSL